MLSREEAKGLSVSTFHTFGLNLLRLELKHTPLKANFSILDVDEKNIESVIRKMVLLDMLEQQQEEEDTDKVNLLTLHASKGLEFPYVYLIGLEEELLPHKNSIVADTVEEERRLMYVGITRARQGLTITLAEQRKAGGQMKQMTPSRFLDELPQDELEWLGRKKKYT